MVSAVQSQELEMDYEVSYRELSLASARRDVCSKDRFNARARFGRGGKRGNTVNGAHRRRDKRNYL
jgi:hypothetical protein